MPIQPGGPGGRIQVTRAFYHFAVDGGAVGTVPLRDGQVPANAIILGGYIEVTTPLTSGGAATVRLDAEAVGDLQAAAAVTGAPWSTAGRKSVTPAFTGATSIKTTAGRVISAVIATAALTGGAFEVNLFWYLPA